MSSDPTSESNLRSFFETALREYEKQAGTNLLDNSFTIKLRNCDSPDDINAILQEQAQAFHKFRGDNGKMSTWLKRTVHVLHTLFTSSALGEGIGLVGWKLSALNILLPRLLSDVSHAAISTRKGHLRRNRYPSRCIYRLIRLITQPLTISILIRQSRM